MAENQELIVIKKYVCNHKLKTYFKNTIYACFRENMGNYCIRCPANEVIFTKWQTKEQKKAKKSLRINKKIKA